MKKLLTLITGVMLSMSSLAGTITHNGYTLDEDSNIVTGGNLQWLQWDVTAGQSFAQAQQTAGNGWVLAGITQMVNLFNAFNFGTPKLDGANAPILSNFEARQDHQFVKKEYDGDNADNPFSKFVSLFGHTGSDYDNDKPDEISAAYFNAGFQVPISGYVFDDFKFNPNPNSQIVNFAPSRAALFDFNNDVANNIGFAFVRDIPAVTQSNQASVPEPSTIAILSLGLLGLAARRRFS